jgi:hypothetical protein
VTKVPITQVPLRGQEHPAGVAKPLQSLAHEPGAAFAERIVVASRLSLARYFVVPGSGARRAAGTQQHAQRFACRFGRPVGLYLRGAGFGGSPYRRDTTTRSTFRVPVRAPRWLGTL